MGEIDEKTSGWKPKGVSGWDEEKEIEFVDKIRRDYGHMHRNRNVAKHIRHQKGEM